MHISLAIPGSGTTGLGGGNFTKCTGITLFFIPGHRGKFATLQKPKDSEMKRNFIYF